MSYLLKKNSRKKMADAPASSSPVAAVAAPSPKKAKAPKSKKAQKPADHPKYTEMIVAAIAALKERNGSSRQAIAKYIKANYKVGDTSEVHLKQALKRNDGKLWKHTKGQGASGSFKLLKAEKPASPKPAKKAATKKPAAAKKVVAKKPAVKKAKKAAKSPTKKAATPKKPKKVAAAKKPVVAKKATPTKKSTPKKASAAKKSPKKLPAKKQAKKAGKK